MGSRNIIAIAVVGLVAILIAGALVVLNNSFSDDKEISILNENMLALTQLVSSSSHPYITADEMRTAFQEVLASSTEAQDKLDISKFRQTLAAIRNSEEASVDLHERIVDDAREQEAIASEKVVLEEEEISACLFGVMLTTDNINQVYFFIPYFNVGTPPPVATPYFLCSGGQKGLRYENNIPEEALLVNPEALLWLVEEDSESKDSDGG